jgi:hypothetical protein
MLWVRISIRTRCTTLCDKVCQWIATGRWFSPGPPVSFTNKTDRRDIAEILLKVALNITKQTNKHFILYWNYLNPYKQEPLSKTFFFKHDFSPCSKRYLPNTVTIKTRIVFECITTEEGKTNIRQGYCITPLSPPR